ncbi:glycosyltransferase family 2 protein [Blastopirellula sp. JC732]|uniref:Glycosyltransferase family 2 protein n=1 Tax=Blastopirellula sediminis TaxID=2894196 RepID=A0A9X1MQA7_9BACT|nr:glycosyltransferase family 2 protein [Blastopirellula sediminis]MCC9606651.1 glycosyltransferase family 2 protein [Blastopirellula sediminis]MCC9630052.1 glycosyltransferase family 2 protein [Blastopirellula sediminis]
MKSPRALTALPVFNERGTVHSVLDEVARYSSDILVVDDGSSDGTAELLAERSDIQVVTHAKNRGYGAALKTAFDYAAAENYDIIVTIDCDGQHEPQRIPRFVAACQNVDIVSGSRYLKQYSGDSEPPAERRWINQLLTAEINQRLGYQLTDAFCGFKAYRVDAISQLPVTEFGYAMPLELWVEAARAGLSVIELPVPLVYLDEKRSFGGNLDDGTTRLNYYHLVLDRTMARGEFGIDDAAISLGG